MDPQTSTDMSEALELPASIELIKFQAVLKAENGANINLICLEFSNQYMIFVTELAVIGTLIEAVPDDPVDMGNPTSYSTTTIFGKEDLTLHLLARRLVEVLQKRLILAISSKSLEVATIRLIEAEFLRSVGDKTASQTDRGFF